MSNTRTTAAAEPGSTSDYTFEVLSFRLMPQSWPLHTAIPKLEAFVENLTAKYKVKYESLQLRDGDVFGVDTRDDEDVGSDVVTVILEGVKISRVATAHFVAELTKSDYFYGSDEDIKKLLRGLTLGHSSVHAAAEPQEPLANRVVTDLSNAFARKGADGVVTSRKIGDHVFKITGDDEQYDDEAILYVVTEPSAAYKAAYHCTHFDIAKVVVKARPRGDLDVTVKPVTDNVKAYSGLKTKYLKAETPVRELLKAVVEFTFEIVALCKIKRDVFDTTDIQRDNKANAAAEPAPHANKHEAAESAFYALVAQLKEKPVTITSGGFRVTARGFDGAGKYGRSVGIKFTSQDDPDRHFNFEIRSGVLGGVYVAEMGTRESMLASSDTHALDKPETLLRLALALALKRSSEKLKHAQEAEQFLQKASKSMFPNAQAAAEPAPSGFADAVEKLVTALQKKHGRGSFDVADTVRGSIASPRVRGPHELEDTLMLRDSESVHHAWVRVDTTKKTVVLDVDGRWYPVSGPSVFTAASVIKALVSAYKDVNGSQARSTAAAEPRTDEPAEDASNTDDKKPVPYVHAVDGKIRGLMQLLTKWTAVEKNEVGRESLREIMVMVHKHAWPRLSAESKKKLLELK